MKETEFFASRHRAIRKDRQNSVSMARGLGFGNPLRVMIWEECCMPRKLPKGWDVRTLGEVTDIFKGGTPKRNVEKYFQGDIA